MKVVINTCYGGFSVSEAVFNELGMKWDGYGYLSNEDFGLDAPSYKDFRAHPRLIAAIEKLGEDASSGELASLQIIEIPDDVEWEIDEYDGIERVAEQHRSWP